MKKKVDCTRKVAWVLQALTGVRRSVSVKRRRGVGEGGEGGSANKALMDGDWIEDILVPRWKSGDVAEVNETVLAFDIGKWSPAGMS